jgi:hypothetical protein
MFLWITFDSLDQIFLKILEKSLLLHRTKKCKSHIMRFLCIIILLFSAREWFEFNVEIFMTFKLQCSFFSHWKHPIEIERYPGWEPLSQMDSYDHASFSKYIFLLQNKICFSASSSKSLWKKCLMICESRRSLCSVWRPENWIFFRMCR